MKRPLFVSMIFLIAGIVMGTFNHGSYDLAISLFPIVLLCGMIFKIYKSKSVAIFILLYAIGFVSVQNSLGVKNMYIDNYAESEFFFTIDARVLDSSFTANGRQRVLLYTYNFNVQNRDFSDNMRIQAILEYDIETYIGQFITVQGQLLQLSRARNPGGFNQFQFLRSRGIQYTMFPVVLSFGDVTPSLRTFLYSTRNRLIYVFDNVLPESKSGIMKSMIIGDRSSLDNDILELYRISGMYHILVISGLHISILMLAINKSLEKIFSQKLSAILTLAFLIFYCLLVGSGVSVVRAVTMSGVLIVAKILHRERDFLTSISFAAVCLLLFEPLYLWDIGFQFSFAAVFGIAIATEPIDRGLGLIFRNTKYLDKIFSGTKFRKSFAVDIVVFLSISPLSAFHFYHFMPYSIIANIVIIFTANILVVLGFTVGVIGLISLSIAEFLAGSIFILLTLYEFVATFFGTMPGSRILIGQPSIILIIGFYFLFLIFNYMLYGFHNEYKRRKKLFISSSAFYIALVLLVNRSDDYLEVTFLDVGQGEAIVLTLNNRVYMIDGGGVRNREVGENVGVRVVLPFLDSQGISRIDTVFLTHEDSDHIIGIIEIIGEKEIGQIITTFGTNREDELFQMLEYRANIENIDIIFIGAGFVYESTDGLFIEVIYPLYGQHFRHVNDTSLVMRLSYKGVYFLFTADIDKPAEYEILRRGKNVSAHVLNVAHHGSRFSTSQIFLDAVSPTVGVVSAGRNNVFGHPTREVIERFEDSGIPLYSTIDSGAVIIRTNGRSIYVTETSVENFN